MFEIGFAELFLLGVIALLVVGPDRLPALARTVGVWVGRAQRLVGQVRADIEREVRADELRKAAKEYSPTGMIGDMRKEVEDFASEVSKPVDLDEEKAGSAKPGPSDPAPAAPAAAPASDAADASAAPESEPAEPEAEEARGGADAPDSTGKPAEDASGPEALGGSSEGPDRVASDAEPESGEPLEAERAESAPSESPAAETNEAQSGTAEDGEPEHTVDSRPAAVSGAEDDVDLTNGQVAVETATAAVTEGPETTPAERDERSAAP